MLVICTAERKHSSRDKKNQTDKSVREMEGKEMRTKMLAPLGSKIQIVKIDRQHKQDIVVGKPVVCQ